jgi:hypothetical protein
MTGQKVAPYGSWKSPITSDLIVVGSIGLSQLKMDGRAVYWTEGRPSENGRNALVKWTPESGLEELSAAGFNVRSRVHEYGGGAYTVHDDAIYFTNFIDQRLYVQYPYSEPEPLTASEPLRFADGLVDARRGRLFCIREDHSTPGQEPANSLVSLNLDSHNEVGTVLAAGGTFYAAPRLSPNGRQLAWLTWNHPNMPWDGTELWVADLDEAGTSLSNRQCVAGGSGRIDLPARMVPQRRFVLHFRSHQLVEFVPLARWHRAANLPDGSRIWPAPVGFWHVHLRL